MPLDVMGHGTACAGIIAADGRRIPQGVGGASRLLPGRALASARFAERPALTALGAIVDIDNALKALVDLGARVLNLSFGTPATALREDDDIPHQDVIAYAQRRGCILVAASGNNPGFVSYYPAIHPSVIAVGAVGENGRPSSFMSRGDHVALCAPGEHIPSATVGGYQNNTGTSFAAPFVAGACALMLARAARYARTLDVDAIRAFLVAHARPFPAATDGHGCGAGVLDIPAALHGLEQALAQSENPWSPVRPLTAAAATLGAAA